MTPAPWLEARVGGLISALADAAPIDVDAMAVTRLAASQRRQSAIRLGWGTTDRNLVLVFATLLLAAMLVSGSLIAGGRLLTRDPIDALTHGRVVEPFIGLPPEGAAASAPERGALAFAFFGRVNDLSLDFHRMWVFADGRLIWVRNLDYRYPYEGGQVTADARDRADMLARPAFGGHEPTRAVIEQHLTPQGVDLIRAEIMKTAEIGGTYAPGDRASWSLPGVLWGGLSIGDGNGRRQVTWSDPALPGRLADPAAWLPATAWDDSRLGAFVPAQYAACIEPASAIERLPKGISDLIKSKAIANGAVQDARCPDRVTTADARIIEAILEAQLPKDPWARLEFSFGGDPARPDGWIELLPVLPNGDTVCNCG
jgi:hypothetical protein